jgi:hypothetical protein
LETNHTKKQETGRRDMERFWPPGPHLLSTVVFPLGWRSAFAELLDAMISGANIKQLNTECQEK